MLGFWVLSSVFNLWDFKPQRSIKSSSPLIALAESPQHCLLGTGVWKLLRMLCNACSLSYGGQGTASALRRGNLDCHRAAGPPRVPYTPKPSFHIGVPGTGKIQAQDGICGRSDGGASPGSHHSLGHVEVGRNFGSRTLLNPLRPRPRPWVPGGRQRSLG